MVAFGGVVIDHVQDYFDPRLVEVFHHLLELLDLPINHLLGAVLGVGSKKPDGVISPIV